MENFRENITAPALTLADLIHCTEKTDFIDNIRGFQREITRFDKFNILSMTRYWFAYEQEPGKFIFAPRGWVGYKNMTKETYELISSMSNSRDVYKRHENTTKHLFNTVIDTEVLKKLKLQLNQFLAPYEKIIHLTSRFKIVDDTPSVKTPKDKFNDLELDYITSVIASWPLNRKMELMRRLENS